MKIEEAIKQSAFASEYQKLGVNLLFTSGWIEAKHSALLKPFDLSIQQFNILRILRGQKGNPLSLLEISDRMIDRMSNCSRLVDKLLAKGLAERKTCPQDRRQVEITITSNGLNLLTQVDSIMPQMHRDMAVLSEEEARTLNALLDKLRGY